METIEVKSNYLHPDPNSDIISSMVSVLVPIFNEVNGIKDVINEIKEVLTEAKINFEIVAIDDGSTDGSLEVLKDIDGIRIFKHLKNIGYGSAIKSGLRKSVGKYIVIIDADGTYPVKMIPKLITELKDQAMVVGARAISSENIPTFRKPMKWIIGKLANYLTQTKIPDLNSGLRAFRRDIAMKFYQMYPKGFSFTTTITLAMHCNGFDVKYIPITYGKRIGKSKINPIKDTINFLQLIYRTVLYFNPLRIFVPLSGIIFIVFMVFFLYDVIYLDNLTDKTLISFQTFIQVFIIGLIADLISKRIFMGN